MACVTAPGNSQAPFFNKSHKVSRCVSLTAPVFYPSQGARPPSIRKELLHSAVNLTGTLWWRLLRIGRACRSVTGTRRHPCVQRHGCHFVPNMRHTRLFVKVQKVAWALHVLRRVDSSKEAAGFSSFLGKTTMASRCNQIDPESWESRTNIPSSASKKLFTCRYIFLRYWAGQIPSTLLSTLLSTPLSNSCTTARHNKAWSPRFYMPITTRIHLTV